MLARFGILPALAINAARLAWATPRGPTVRKMRTLPRGFV
jgi:hypothetical protein